MVALWNRADHTYFHTVVCSYFFFFSSPNLSHCRLDVCHTSTHGVALVQISEIVNYLGQVTSEVKWDNFRFVARETMFVNKQMYAGNPLLRYYFDCH